MKAAEKERKSTEREARARKISAKSGRPLADTSPGLSSDVVRVGDARERGL